MTAVPALVSIARFAVETPEKDPSVVAPGLLGFLVTFFLALATLFLIRSMVKHLRKVRYGPDPYGEESPGPAGTPTTPEDPGR